MQQRKLFLASFITFFDGIYVTRDYVKSDGHLILLQTNNTNQHIFNSFITHGTLPAKNDLQTHADQNIFEGIKGCIQFTKQWKSDYGDVLSLLRIIRNKLGFVVFDTDDARIVYSVFEVLNSRGLAVDWLDKCKSLLMGIAYDKAKTDDSRESFITQLNDLWGNIYQQISKYPIQGQEILRVTATLYTGTESSKPQKADTALSSLANSCLTPEQTIEVSNQILEVTKKLVELQSNVRLAPVTNILQARVLAVAISLTGSINNDEKQKLLKQWEKVTFRIYGLFSKDSRSKVGDYIRLANKIMNNSSGASRYSEIMDSIKVIGSDYHIERAIEEEMRGKNIYEGNQEVVRYILWRYEEHLTQGSGSNAIVNEEFKTAVWSARNASQSIEHIMPQNPESGGAWEGKYDKSKRFENIVSCIGNLILLPMSLNDEAKRQGFLAKKSVYQKSEGLRMVKEVLDYSDWTSEKIKDREKQILDWVKIEWADTHD